MTTPVSTGEITLYAAATEALVSESSGNSTYEKMIAVAFTHSSIDTFNKEVRDTEKIIKKEFEISSMPGPWRSSKSVVLGAMKLGIKLIDDNGEYRGKTYLQNKIKESKIKDKEIPVEEYINKILYLLNHVPPHLTKEEVWTAVGVYVKEL